MKWERGAVQFEENVCERLRRTSGKRRDGKFESCFNVWLQIVASCSIPFTLRY